MLLYRCYKLNEKGEKEYLANKNGMKRKRTLKERLHLECTIGQTKECTSIGIWKNMNRCL